MHWLSILLLLLVWQKENVAASSVFDNCSSLFTPVDIVVMVDGKFSAAGVLKYAIIRHALVNQLTKMNINYTQSRIGFITYNYTWRLNEIHTSADMINSLKTLMKRQGDPSTGEGLSFALQTFRRTSVPKMMILISDGESKDNVTQRAQRLRDFGIVFYVFGLLDITKVLAELLNTSGQYWRAIASRPRHPEDQYIFRSHVDLILSICHQIQYQDKKIKNSVGHHSLYYIYTFVLRDDGQRSLGATAMGLLDDQPIEVYSSQHQTWAPETQWMENNMPAEYWQTGNLQMEALNVTVFEIMQDNCESALCVLQWRVGCEAEKLANESLSLQKLVEEYSLNGEHIQDTDVIWHSETPAVKHSSPPGQILEGARNITRHFTDFLQKECVDQEMRRFIIYNDREPSAPNATVLPPRNMGRSRVLLSCMATGFFPRYINISFQKNGVTVPDAEGTFHSSGSRPNGDGMFQLRRTLEIVECFEPHDVLYECVVEHTSTKYLQTFQIIKLDGFCGFILRVRSGVVLASLLLLVLFHVFFNWLLKRRAANKQCKSV